VPLASAKCYLFEARPCQPNSSVEDQSAISRSPEELGEVVVVVAVAVAVAVAAAVVVVVVVVVVEQG